VADWRHRIWLYLDEEDPARTAQAVRSFREISSFTVVGLAYWVAHGVFGVRSMQENGGVDFLVDARLSGNDEELYQAALSLFHNHVVGVSLHPLVQDSGVREVVRAAQDSLQLTLQTRAPQIMFSAKIADRQSFCDAAVVSPPTESEFMAWLVSRARRLGCRGTLVDRTTDLITHKQWADQLAVPTSRPLTHLELADRIVGVLRRKALAAVVPLSLLPNEDSIERCVDRTGQVLATLLDD
jgi:hypothetical protein